MKSHLWRDAQNIEDRYDGAEQLFGEDRDLAGLQAASEAAQERDERAALHDPATCDECEELRAAADLRAAKERLGARLVACYGRLAIYREPDGAKRVSHQVQLFSVDDEYYVPLDCWVGPTGEGPTEAAAILAALEKVNA